MGDDFSGSNPKADPVLNEISEARRRADEAHAEPRARQRGLQDLARKLTEAFWAKNEAIPPALRTIHSLVPLTDLPAETLAQRVVRDLVIRSIAGKDAEALKAFGDAANLVAGGDPGSMTPSQLYAWFQDRPPPPKHPDGTDFSLEERNISHALNVWLPELIAERARLVWKDGGFYSPTSIDEAKTTGSSLMPDATPFSEQCLPRRQDSCRQLDMGRQGTTPEVVANLTGRKTSATPTPKRKKLTPKERSERTANAIGIVMLLLNNDDGRTLKSIAEEAGISVRRLQEDEMFMQAWRGLDQSRAENRNRRSKGIGDGYGGIAFGVSETSSDDDS